MLWALGTFFIDEKSAIFTTVSKCFFRRCHLLSEIVSVNLEVVFIYHSVVLNERAIQWECDYKLLQNNKTGMQSILVDTGSFTTSTRIFHFVELLTMIAAIDHQVHQVYHQFKWLQWKDRKNIHSTKIAAVRINKKENLATDTLSLLHNNIKYYIFGWWTSWIINVI